jgi:hypothetical protein
MTDATIDTITHRKAERLRRKESQRPRARRPRTHLITRALPKPARRWRPNAGAATNEKRPKWAVFSQTLGTARHAPGCRTRQGLKPPIPVPWQSIDPAPAPESRGPGSFCEGQQPANQQWVIKPNGWGIGRNVLMKLVLALVLALGGATGEEAFGSSVSAGWSPRPATKGGYASSRAEG